MHDGLLNKTVPSNKCNLERCQLRLHPIKLNVNIEFKKHDIKIWIQTKKNRAIRRSLALRTNAINIIIVPHVTIRVASHFEGPNPFMNVPKGSNRPMHKPIEPNPLMNKFEGTSNTTYLVIFKIIKNYIKL